MSLPRTPSSPPESKEQQFEGVVFVDFDQTLQVLRFDPDGEGAAEIFISDPALVHLTFKVLEYCGYRVVLGSQRAFSDHEDNKQDKQEMLAYLDHTFNRFHSDGKRSYLKKEDIDLIKTHLNEEKISDAQLGTDKSPLLEAAKQLPGCGGIQGNSRIFLIDDDLIFKDPIKKAGYGFIHAKRFQQHETTQDRLYLAELLTTVIPDKEKLVEAINACAGTQTKEADTLRDLVQNFDKYQNHHFVNFNNLNYFFHRVNYFYERGLVDKFFADVCNADMRVLRAELDGMIAELNELKQQDPQSFGRPETNLLDWALGCQNALTGVDKSLDEIQKARKIFPDFKSEHWANLAGPFKTQLGGLSQRLETYLEQNKLVQPPDQQEIDQRIKQVKDAIRSQCFALGLNIFTGARIWSYFDGRTIEKEELTRRVRDGEEANAVFLLHLYNEARGLETPNDLNSVQVLRKLEKIEIDLQIVKTQIKPAEDFFLIKLWKEIKKHPYITAAVVLTLGAAATVLSGGIAGGVIAAIGSTIAGAAGLSVSAGTATAIGASAIVLGGALASPVGFILNELSKVGWKKILLLTLVGAAVGAACALSMGAAALPGAAVFGAIASGISAGSIASGLTVAVGLGGALVGAGIPLAVKLLRVTGELIVGGVKGLGRLIFKPKAVPDAVLDAIPNAALIPDSERSLHSVSAPNFFNSKSSQHDSISSIGSILNRDADFEPPDAIPDPDAIPGSDPVPVTAASSPIPIPGSDQNINRRLSNASPSQRPSRSSSPEPERLIESRSSSPAPAPQPGSSPRGKVSDLTIIKSPNAREIAPSGSESPTLQNNNTLTKS